MIQSECGRHNYRTRWIEKAGELFPKVTICAFYAHLMPLTTAEQVFWFFSTMFVVTFL